MKRNERERERVKSPLRRHSGFMPESNHRKLILLSIFNGTALIGCAVFFIFIFSTNSGADTNAGTCLPVSKGGTGCDKASLLQWIGTELYPVGTILTTTDNTNPAARFDGTWEAFGQGRTLIGVGSNVANTDTTYGSMAAGTVNRASSGLLGGVATATSGSTAITVAQMPAHTHPGNKLGTIDGSDFGFPNNATASQSTTGYTISPTPDSSARMFQPANSLSYWYTGSYSINSQGGGQGHTHSVPTIQPYVTVYFWKRTN